MQPVAAPCPERKILEGRLRADAKVYADAVRRLDEATESGRSREEFDRTWKDAEGARMAFERARVALNHHVSAHGCG